MKCLITGGLGFVGYNLCSYLKQNSNCDITVIDNCSTGKSSNKIEGINYIDDTITNKYKVHHLIRNFRPEVVFHLAAIPRVSYSVENPFETTDANVIGTLNILEAIRLNELKCRMVFSSSSSVYGGAGILPTPEDHPKNPKSPYALQKSQGEEWCQIYSSLYGIETVILRYFNIFGYKSLYGGSYSVVIPAWAYSVFKDKTLKPYIDGDGSQSRDFTFIDNVVQANFLAATIKKQMLGEIFNIAQGQSCSLIKLLSIFKNFTSQDIDVEYRPPRIGDVKDTLADISKAKKILNYNPDIDFENQIFKTLTWYKNYYASSSEIQQSN